MSDSDHEVVITTNGEGHIQPVYGRCAACKQLVYWSQGGNDGWPGRWRHFRDDAAYWQGNRKGETWGRTQGNLDGHRDGVHEAKTTILEDLRSRGLAEAADYVDASVIGRPGCGEPHATWHRGCQRCEDVEDARWEYDW